MRVLLQLEKVDGSALEQGELTEPGTFTADGDTRVVLVNTGVGVPVHAIGPQGAVLLRPHVETSPMRLNRVGTSVIFDLADGETLELALEAFQP